MFRTVLVELGIDNFTLRENVSSVALSTTDPECIALGSNPLSCVLSK